MKGELSPDPDVVKAIREIVEQGTGRFGFQSLQVDARTTMTAILCSALPPATARREIR
jgi:hypothetical protein